jgi:hypothetical protein
LQYKHVSLKIFSKLIGCTDDELAYAQKWSTRKLVEIMREFSEFGHHNLITDLKRDKSIFDLRPQLAHQIDKTLKLDGSYFGFVKSNCIWRANDYEQQNQIEFIIDHRTAQLMPTILK